jgi:hypothetical protein
MIGTWEMSSPYNPSSTNDPSPLALGQCGAIMTVIYFKIHQHNHYDIVPVPVRLALIVGLVS